MSKIFAILTKVTVFIICSGILILNAQKLDLPLIMPEIVVPKNDFRHSCFSDYWATIVWRLQCVYNQIPEDLFPDSVLMRAFFQDEQRFEDIVSKLGISSLFLAQLGIQSMVISPPMLLHQLLPILKIFASTRTDRERAQVANLETALNSYIAFIYKDLSQCQILVICNKEQLIFANCLLRLKIEELTKQISIITECTPMALEQKNSLQRTIKELEYQLITREGELRRLDHVQICVQPTAFELTV